MARVRVRHVRALLLGPVLFVTAGCGEQEMLRRIVPPDVDQYARAIIDTLAVAPIERVAASFSPRLIQEAGVLDSLRTVQRELMAVGVPDSATLVGGHLSNYRTFDGATSNVYRDISYEVYGPRGLVLAQMRVIDAAGQRHIDALRVQRLDAPLRVINGFWQNLGLAQGLMLVVAIGLFVFTVGSAVAVARTPMPKRWLWVLVALVGVGKFAMDWTTGVMATSMLSLQLFNAALTNGGSASPWIIAVSFPIGAILALRHRAAVLARARDGDAVISPSSTDAAVLPATSTEAIPASDIGEAPPTDAATGPR